MNAYIWVYRRNPPYKGHWYKTTQEADSDPNLQKFLSEFLKPDCYLDWGDDPSFFCARECLDDLRRVSLGVCRPGWRKRQAGDLLIFFCAQASISNLQEWEDYYKKGSKTQYPRIDCWKYYYVGFGTIRRLIDPWQVWCESEYEIYRDFYNVLAEPKDIETLCNDSDMSPRVLESEFRHRETFYPRHDWKKSVKAPYLLFEGGENLTCFNITNPHCVAEYIIGHDPPERWNSHKITRRLQNVLYSHEPRLRARPTYPCPDERNQRGYPHPFRKVRLPTPGAANLENLRKGLLGVSNAINLG
ncbi:hypothetical protein MYX82_09950 [Acidobacteria bacterium AH-259-D05]|nr:hypothetical protein [Acidobacteria bacterium AH-259-D05]